MQSIEFPTKGGLSAYMNYYPPKNRDYEFPPGELPALLVRIHGGPTSAATTALSLSYQFWTSRGERAAHSCLCLLHHSCEAGCAHSEQLLL